MEHRITGNYPARPRRTWCYQRCFQNEQAPLGNCYPKNAYPEIYGLANHTVNEREVARIAGTVGVSDANLDNSSSSNQWQNASITITRDGSANPQ